MLIINLNLTRYNILSYSLLFLLIINIMGDINALDLNPQSQNIKTEFSHESPTYKIPRLVSDGNITLDNTSNNISPPIYESPSSSNKEKLQNITSSPSSDESLNFPPPKFGIMENLEINITKITPEAMEKDTGSLPVTINFTLGNIAIEVSAVLNVTLNNGSTYRISGWESGGWSEHRDENGSFIDSYALEFVLNNSFIASIALGSYNLIIYTNVSGQVSSDSISFPMEDFDVNIVQVSSPEFFTKVEDDQPFLFDIVISTNFGLGPVPETTPPINPSGQIKSVVNIGFFNFIDINLTNPSLGRYSLNFSLPAGVAQTFEEGEHLLIISVFSSSGISDNDSRSFFAKDTVFLVEIDELKVDINPPIDYDDLISSQENVIFRLNVNDSIIIAFHVLDNTSQTISERVHNIGIWNPDEPEDPTAVIYEETNAAGFGTVSLNAISLTPYSGYTLTLFVRGHRGSQELNPTNITIYWDLLDFNYVYRDNLNNTGSRYSLNQKALGVDVNESWTLELGLFYASDGTAAIGGNISYRFGGGIWTPLMDDSNGDSIDGFFPITYTHSTASRILFECQIISGSSFDPQGTLFVNKTLTEAIFDLTITWTYLIVDMIPQEADQRVSTSTSTSPQTYIQLSATWAHDANLTYNDILIVKDHFWVNRPDQWQLVNGTFNYPVFPNTITGRYRYSITGLGDNAFGVTKYTNSSVLNIETPQVQVFIIFETIKFLFSNEYDSSLPVDHENQTWNIESSFEFYTNYGENGTLYIYGRHSYDNTPFNGSADLYALETAFPYSISFINGLGIWQDDLTGEGSAITFRIMNIARDDDFGVTRVGSYNRVGISWDKLVITLSSNLSYSHGTWADINVSYNYLILPSETINPANIRYTLEVSTGTIFQNISWVQFQDFCFGTAVRTYSITKSFDFNTGLTAALIQYDWLDQSMDPLEGNLTIYWIDDKTPTIVEISTYDIGNGSILIIVEASDNSERWNGTGISNVTLRDLRQGKNVDVPLNATHILLPSGNHQYVFKYSFNQEIISDYNLNFFQFEFDKPLIFSLRIRDRGTNFSEPALGTLQNSNTFVVPSFEVQMDYDPFQPEFIITDGTTIQITYPPDDQEFAQERTDGEIIISTFIYDPIWSGIDPNNVQLIITDLELNTSNFVLMFIDIQDDRRFYWEGTLFVGRNYRLKVDIMDQAGNMNSRSILISVEDHVAPRIKAVSIKSNNNRQVQINVSVEDIGFGVEFVEVYFLNSRGKGLYSVNLSLQTGSGSSFESSSQTQIYYSTVTLPLDLSEILTPKSFTIEIFVEDRAGNPKRYTDDDLKALGISFEGSLIPLIFFPPVLLGGLILFISGILVGIRISSRTEGYDMKRIITEGEKIPREVILTQMDEYALGVTINFFDQVQGPVPVIWEPPLLEDQEQVILDLSDKSFSTLEFIGLEETERSGTFDFSTGSYDCTALGYSFAIDNPQARGGKENLTVVLLLRKEWGDNLLIFQDEIIEKLREIRKMIETQVEPTQIKKEARNLREFVSRLMLSFNKIYTGIDYELVMQED